MTTGGKMRPEGFKNPYAEIDSNYKSRHYKVFEAGADAMLEGLTSQEHQDYLATAEGESCKGKWVFIPEETR